LTNKFLFCLDRVKHFQSNFNNLCQPTEMPPKKQSTNISSPAKSDGKSQAAGSGSDSARRTRRPSNGSLESVATAADLADLDANGRGGGHGGAPTPSSAASSSLSSSAPAAMSQTEIALLQSVLSRFTSSTPAANTAAAATAPAAAPTPAQGLGAILNNLALPPAVPTSNSVGAAKGFTSALPPKASLLPALATAKRDADDDDTEDEYSDHDDSDEEKLAPDDGSNDIRWRSINIPFKKRWAPASCEDTLRVYRTFSQRAMMKRCKDIRNRFEIDNLSIICDAALVGRCDVILELAIRRMMGVEAADDSGGRDWDTAAAVDVVKPGAFGNDELRRQLRKDAAAIKAAKPKQNASSGGSGRGRGRGRGRGGRGRGRGGRGRGGGGAAAAASTTAST
jgi:uncharacterized membrane protein YgcG